MVGIFIANRVASGGRMRGYIEQLLDDGAAGSIDLRNQEPNPKHRPGALGRCGRYWQH